MEVEVVPGQVGESADLEMHTVDAAKGQRVTGHLHHHGVDALLDHHGQQRLQVGRLGGGQRAGLISSVDADADSTDQPGHPLRRPEPGFDEVGGRGFAGRSGDTDDA